MEKQYITNKKFRNTIITMCLAFVMAVGAIVGIWAATNQTFSAGFNVSYRVGENIAVGVRTQKYIPTKDDAARDAETIENTHTDENGYVNFNATQSSGKQVVDIGTIALTPQTPAVEFYFTIKSLQKANYIQVIFEDEYTTKNNVTVKIKYYNTSDLSEVNDVASIADSKFTNKMYDNVEVNGYKIIKITMSVKQVNNSASCEGNFSIGLHYDDAEQSVIEVSDLTKLTGEIDDSTTKVVYDYLQKYPTYQDETQYSPVDGIVTITEGKTVYVLAEDTISPTTCMGMFSRKPNLTSIKLTNFDTSAVTTMDTMFAFSSNIKELDVSKFDTSNVTSMRGMFSQLSELEKLEVDNFTTDRVANMYAMFYECSKLTEINVGNFSVDACEDFSYMFRDMVALKELDVRHFDLTDGNVANPMLRDVKTKDMFEGLNSLEELLLPEYFIVEDYTFNHIPKWNLTTFKIPNNWVFKGTSHIFYNCATASGNFTEFVLESNERTDLKVYKGVLYQAIAENNYEVLAVPSGIKGENIVNGMGTLDILEGTTRFGELSFSRVVYIDTLRLPNSFIIEFDANTDSTNSDSNYGLNLNVGVYKYTSISKYIVKSEDNIDTSKGEVVNPNYISYNGCIYSKDGKKLIAVPYKWGLGETNTVLELKSTTEVIGIDAFWQQALASEIVGTFDVTNHYKGLYMTGISIPNDAVVFQSNTFACGKDKVDIHFNQKTVINNLKNRFDTLLASVGGFKLYVNGELKNSIA